MFENTWPGKPGQYPKVDKAAQVVESFLYALVVKNAVGLGSTAQRVHLFWTNWYTPENLQASIPTDIVPSPTLKQIPPNTRKPRLLIFFFVSTRVSTAQTSVSNQHIFETNPSSTLVNSSLDTSAAIVIAHNDRC